MRQVVGYDRLVGEHAYRQLTELYRALRLYVNCFQPSMKLLSKERDGKKVRCVYDPAKTPLQRLLLSGVLPVQKQQELTEVAQALDPVRLLHQLEQLQQDVFRCAVGCTPFVSSPLSDSLHVFSVEQCPAGKLPAEGSVPDPTAGSGPACSPLSFPVRPVLTFPGPRPFLGAFARRDPLPLP